MKHLTINGNLVSNAHFKQLENGKQLLSYKVAVDDSYTNSENERVERTDFITCFETRKQFSDAYINILCKGNNVTVIGVPKFGLNSYNNQVHPEVTINVYTIAVNNIRKTLEVVESETEPTKAVNSKKAAK